MTIKLDERQGRGLGAHIRLAGRVLGLSLQIDEVVTVYDPPERKVWATVGEPQMLVIGSYQMGFEVRPHAHASEVRVVLDYAWPPGAIGRVLGWLLAGWYARWCTRRMVHDAQRYFRAAASGGVTP